MKTPTAIRALAVASAAALSLGLAACGESEPSMTIEEGVLTVCTNPPYAPFEDLVGGEVVGFDMDLMTEVAKDLDLEVAFVEAPFEAIESAAALDTGTCDVGASGLTITEDRLAKLDFSQPYYETTMGLLVKADSGVKGLADLKGKPVGVQQGTTGEDWARAQEELTEDTIKQFESLGDQVTALKSGDVAGIFNDEPTLTPYVEEGFAVVGAFDTGEEFGFAAKKGSTDLIDAINKTLDRVTSDGTYETLVEKWFTKSAD
ncbi:MAG: transporter substrate-binding domain-containing protein [Bifidobacteriaceae bacterium]|jgi:polar amino acid transport system substrate-binding protein|nr:transporter substrate-binding domain-containing protein [Bifidobacteriaceae bacterium]